MDSLIVVVILGVIEGLTEFIPVSSTGHLILFSSWLDYEGPRVSSFNIFIQLGAILAVVFLYRDRFLGLIKKVTYTKEKWVSAERKGLTLFHLVLTILPVMLAGVFFYSTIKDKLFNNTVVVIGLIVGGIVMIVTDHCVAKRTAAPDASERTHSLDTISYLQAFGVGVAQCFSLWPGVSRAGATIVGGVITGLDYKIAAEYSFIVAVPVMAMAVGYDLLKTFSELTTSDLVYFGLGGFVSFIVAMFAIKVFIGLVQRFKLAPFGWYRIVLGVVVFLMIYF